MHCMFARARGRPTSVWTRKGEGNRGKNAGEVSIRDWAEVDGVGIEWVYILTLFVYFKSEVYRNMAKYVLPF